MFDLKSLLVLPFPKNNYWYYRWFMNVLILVTVTMIPSMPFNDSLKDRYNLVFKYPFGLFMYVITLFCTSIAPFTFKWIQIEKIEEIKEQRSFEMLWELNAFADVKECAEYGIVRKPTLKVYFYFD